MAPRDKAARAKLLDAALFVIRRQGYSASTVDDICREAGVTKGAFFHHFSTKQELAVEAARHFADMAEGLFETAPYRALPTARERVLGYVEFRKAILSGDLPQCTCLLGTMVQEAYETHPAIREVCGRHISAHASTLESDIAEALEEAGADSDITAESLALYTQVVLQGAFVLAKAQWSIEVATDSLDHLLRYLRGVLRPAPTRRASGPSGGESTDRRAV